MRVKPIKDIQFHEQISIIDLSDKHEQFIINGKTRGHYVLDKNFEIKYQFEAPYDRRTSSAVHPREPLAAIMGKDDVLRIVDFKGTNIWSKPGEYIAACWSLDGAMLYTLLRIDSNTLRLIVYDNAGAEIAEKTIEDELYESSATILTIPNHTEMVMQLMAGQDGCSTIFVSMDDAGRLFLRPLHERYSYTSVAFNDSGTRFLCIENDAGEIYHFTFPELEEIGVYKFGMDDCNLDYTLIHLEDRAVISYGENFYLLDLESMEQTDDLIIEGHEPVPANQIYKNLVHDFKLICGISYLCVAGDSILGYTNKNGGNNVIVLRKADLTRTK